MALWILSRTETSRSFVAAQMEVSLECRKQANVLKTVTCSYVDTHKKISLRHMPTHAHER